MDTQSPVSLVKQKISEAKSIAILLPQQHSVDVVAAGLALYLALEQTYSPNREKKVTIVTSTEVTVAFQRLYGVGSIKNELGSKNLVITLKTNHENIEKVSYDNENDLFNLIIETKEGVPSLRQGDVTFSYRGIDADLLITIELVTPEDVGSLLISEPKLFSDRETVTISSQPNATSFGQVNYHDPSASGVSEMVTKLLRTMRLTLDPDTATNLIAGIEAATNNFTYKSSADTFAAMSFCMKSGGRRNHLSSPTPSQPSYQAGGVLQQQQPKEDPRFPQPPFKQREEEASQNLPSDDSAASPKDWFGPKIFRSADSKS